MDTDTILELGGEEAVFVVASEVLYAYCLEQLIVDTRGLFVKKGPRHREAVLEREVHQDRHQRRACAESNAVDPIYKEGRQLLFVAVKQRENARGTSAEFSVTQKVKSAIAVRRQKAAA